MGKEATRVRRRERKNIASGVAHVNALAPSVLAAANEQPGLDIAREADVRKRALDRLQLLAVVFYCVDHEIVTLPPVGTTIAWVERAGTVWLLLVVFAADPGFPLVAPVPALPALPAAPALPGHVPDDPAALDRLTLDDFVATGAEVAGGFGEPPVIVGYSIGGVSPIGHVVAPVTLIDEDLLKLASLWAAAGHPHAVFNLTPQQLVAMTGAPVVDVALRG